MGFEPAVFMAVLLQWGVAAIPSRIANRNVEAMLTVARGAMVANLVCALWGCIMSFIEPFLPHAFEPVHWNGISIAIFCDRLSLTMYLLVSFVGLAVLLYSGRYLQGEKRQGRFVRWLSFTLAAVCTMVLAANLIVFFVAWVLTSFGLHQLLTHYGDRPNAQRVAFKKQMTSTICVSSTRREVSEGGRCATRCAKAWMRVWDSDVRSQSATPSVFR